MKESASVPDLMSDPTVSPTLIVRVTPTEMRHTTKLSDDHSVASHAVPIIRAFKELAMTPMPNPTTVVDMLPTRVLTADTEDNPDSYDTASVSEPTCAPI
eukprot:2362788-Rhodomonas_salina.1